MFLRAESERKVTVLTNKQEPGSRAIEEPPMLSAGNVYRLTRAVSHPKCASGTFKNIP